MKKYQSLPDLFRDVGLSIVKKHKASGLSSICPLEFAEKIDAIDQAEDADKVALGEVKDLWFSIVGGILTICWRDPLDVIYQGSTISYFGATTLRGKLGSYPTGPDDGIQLYSGMTRNRHSSDPLVVDLDSAGLIQDDGQGSTQTIYFKFFSKTSGSAIHDGIWNTDTLVSGANEFSSESYDWNAIYSALKNYTTARDQGILPDPGSRIYVDYIVRDYYVSSGVNVAAETRQDVVNNVDKLSSVSTPWTILGYNANVPQYVGYRRLDEFTGTYKYVFAQSVDDSMSSIAFSSIDGTQRQVQINVGNTQFCPIAVGKRLYFENEWDYQVNKKSYSDAGFTIDAAGESTFSYNNEGTGAQNVYSVPLKISADGYEWQFCGYTMTIQPQHSLISVNRTSNTGTTTYNNIQFDAAEILYASPHEQFPDSVGGDRIYVRMTNDGISEIDWSSMASAKFNELDYDVYELNGDKLHLKTAYYQKYCGYTLKSTDSETGAAVYENMVEILDFKVGDAYYTTCDAKNYDKTNRNLSVVADIVRYNGQLYVCKSNVTGEQGKTFEQLSASNFRKLSSAAELSVKALYEAGKYFVPGEKIPLAIDGKEIVERNILNYNNGRNTYEQSFYKQYCNNIDGSRQFSDSPYKPQHRHDVVSTAGLANANSLMLKLYKEQQMIRHIVPAVNRTVISPINGPYRPDTYIKNKRQTWETSIDLFWPLANYEVFGSGADATSKFSKVYPNNAARIKYNMAANGSQSSTAVNWWLRYPHPGHSNTEYYVFTSGSSYNNFANSSYGFAPACIIG